MLSQYKYICAMKASEFVEEQNLTNSIIKNQGAHQIGQGQS